MSLTYLSVCSGIEAASVAWEPLGFKPIGFSEIEPFPCSVLMHHFPTVPNYGDLTQYKQWPVEKGAADILVGGTPCQSFSTAGLRAGLDDPRGNLALTYMGLVDKIRPRWIVWENVPGVLSSNDGRDFGAILGALGELGYGWAYRILDAQYFGVPQRRRRIFLVAHHSGDARVAGEVLSIREGMRGYLEASRAKGKFNTASPEERAVRDLAKGGDINCDASGITGSVSCKWSKGSGGPAGMEYFNMVAVPFRKSKRAQTDEDYETWVDDDRSNTMNVFDSGDTRTTHVITEVKKARRLTPVECERLQGFPDNFTKVPFRGKNASECKDTNRYKAIGNSMAVPVVRWIGERIKFIDEQRVD